MATFSVQIMDPKKDGTRRIRIILYHNKVRIGIPTDIYVNKKDVTPKGNLKDYRAKESLETILKSYRDKCNQCGAMLDSLNAGQVKGILTHSVTVDFIGFFRRYIEKAKIKGIKNYKSALNSLIKYNGGDYLDINDINYAYIKGYEDTLSGRAVSLYLGSIRKVFNEVVMEYNTETRTVVKFNPFLKYKIPKQHIAEKRALPVDVIREIIHLPYTEADNTRRDLAKDCFILSLGLMGMNSVDMYNATIYEDGYIKYDRTKTKDRRNDKAEIHVKVYDCIGNLFEKYRGKRRVFNFYRRYSSPSDLNRAINIGLKEITEELNKTRPAEDKLDKIQFYSARHSFATIAYNDVRIDKYTVNEMLNHTDRSMSITDLYIKKDFTRINEANKKVLDYIFK